MRRPAWIALAFLPLFAIAGTVQAQANELPDGPGKAIVQRACAACHPITQVTSQRRPASQWADTVDQMISRGAQVSDTDFPTVVDYLGKYFGPPATPVR
jgi:mono/diheme cytochrome c family protein